MSKEFDQNFVEKVLIPSGLLALIGWFGGIELIYRGIHSISTLFIGLIVSVICLAILPRVAKLPSEQTTIIQRLKNYKLEYIRLGISSLISLGLIIFSIVIIGQNFSIKAEAKQRAIAQQEEQAQRELEKIQHEKDKQDTPKPEITMITNLSQKFTSTGVLVDFSVSNADQVSINGKLLTKVDSYSDTFDIYQTSVELTNLENSITILAENEYWQDRYIDKVMREKNEEEIKKDELKKQYGECIFYSSELCYTYLSQKPYISRISAKQDCEAIGGDLTTKKDIELYGDSLSELVTNENITHIWTREEETIYGRVYGLRGNRSDRATKKSEKRSYVGYFCVKDLEIQATTTNIEAIKEAKNKMTKIYKEMQLEHQHWLEVLSKTKASPEFAKTINRIKKLRDKINPFEKPYTNNKLKELQMAIRNYSSEIASLAPGWYDSERKESIERTQNEVEKLLNK